MGKLQRLMTKKNWNKVKRMIAQGQLEPAVRGALRKLKQKETKAAPSYAYAQVKERYLRRKNAIQSNMLGVTADIIVPVYNGKAYVEKLLSGIVRTDLTYHLILIDDASTEEETMLFLQQYAEAHPEVNLVRNAHNMGFVGSVNRGLAMARNHVVIVNTDVELPDHWLERLLAPIVKDETVASATPFTNSGTICSFPKFNQDNHVFNDLPVDQIDAVFREIRSLYYDIPTGVGFCMALSQTALREVGLFDQKTFGRGYGEENDWCQRAIEKGFRNVMVENLYVYHNHGGSFQAEEKRRLIKANQEKLAIKHPRYADRVGTYLDSDPMGPVRAYVFCRLTAAISARRYLIFHNQLGGGSDAYIQQYAGKRRNENAVTAIVRYIKEKNHYQVEYQWQAIRVFFHMETLDELFDFCFQMDMNQVIVNQLVTYPNLKEHLRCIREFAEAKGCRIMMMVHDYYLICPSIYLLNEKHAYCKIPPIADCEQCIRQNANCDNFETTSVWEWRQMWLPFLQACQEVRVFSEDSLHLVQRAFGGLEQVRVLPVQHTGLPPVEKTYKTTDTLNIGLLGTFIELKGAGLIRQMCKIAEAQKLPIRFILCGAASEPIHSKYFRQTGPYQPEMLPELALQNDIDIFFIASVCPETFSYTTQEAMEMHFPVACLPLGAPAERIVRYNKGKVLSAVDAEKNLQELMAWGEKFRMPRTGAEKALIVVQEESYASRYRGEHLQEQLYKEGVEADICEITQVKNGMGRMYKWIVLYRCEASKKTQVLIEEASRSGASIWYGVDDLVFDYQAIRTLDFMQQKEYRTFEKRVELMAECLKSCEGVLVSTEALKREVQRCFPEKTVIVQRNVVSYAMIALSNKAYSREQGRREDILLGYFSGSSTHNADFQQIEPVLIELLQKYPRLKLCIGGVLEVSSDLQGFGERVVVWPFKPWRDLPDMLVEMDINLMPLQKTVFHECKSENKWLEAALVGIPTVATYNEELAGVIREGIDGLLCRSQEEWREKLTRLIESEEERKAIGQAARERVLEAHTTCQLEEEVRAIFGR